MVNGCQSQALPLSSGIRQGCPLAPLLFLLVVEMLRLALRQDTSLEGLDAPRLPGETHFFSAFVDDSTLFLAKARQIPHAFSIIHAFGALSGLQVQPTKSKIIFLYRAITIECYAGIEVVPPGGTTRWGTRQGRGTW